MDRSNLLVCAAAVMAAIMMMFAVAVVQTDEESDAVTDSDRAILCDVTFVPNYTGGAIDATGGTTVHVVKGNEIELPCEIFTNSGYYLDQWTVGSISGEGKEPGAKVQITDDTVFYAKWTPVSGTVITDITRSWSVGENINYTLVGDSLFNYYIEDIQKNGADWINLVCDSNENDVHITGNISDPGVYHVKFKRLTAVPLDSGEVFCFTITVPSDTDKVITFSYDSDGGSNITLPSFQLRAGCATTLPDQGVTYKSGQDLIGWKINDGANNYPIYALGSAYTAGADLYDDVGGEITLTAAWQPTANVVVLNASGATGVSFVVATEGQILSLPDEAETNYEKPGYSLHGWYYDTDSEVIFAPDYLYEVGSAVNGAIYVNAYWVADGTDTYTITYNANGGDDYSLSQSVEYGLSVATPVYGFTMAEHSFIGWSTEPKGGELIIAGQPFTPTKDTVLYAQYTEGTTGEDSVFTVSFDPSPGSGTFATQEIQYGGYAREPAAKPTRDGHVFAGWAQTGFATAWDFDSNRVYQDIVLRAMWSEHFTVSFDGSKATVSIASGLSNLGLSSIDWGDGEVSDDVSVSASHTYTGDIDTSITVTTVDASGKSYVSSRPITVDGDTGGEVGGGDADAPKANGSIIDNKDGTYTLSAAGSTNYTRLIWNVNGSNVSTDRSFTLSDLQPGTYNVTLTVVSGNLTDTWEKSFIVPEDESEEADITLYVLVGIVLLAIIIVAWRMFL